MNPGGRYHCRIKFFKALWTGGGEKLIYDEFLVLDLKHQNLILTR